MSRHDLEPLAPEIADLLAAERRAPAPPAARQQRILSRVEAAVGIGAGVATSAASVQAVAGAKTAVLVLPLSKVWIAVVALSGVGLGAGAVLYQRADRASASAPASAAVSSAAIGLAGQVPLDGPGPVRAAVSPPSAPPAARAASAGTPVRSGVATVTASDDIVAESALLEGARLSLAEGDARGALGRITRHARLFPRGLLVEERDALWIQALVLAGDHGAARARAAAFHRRFPDSIQRDAIDRAFARSTDSRGGGQ